MEINRNILLGAALIVVSVLLELFWIQTGSAPLGIFSLIAALISSAALARSVRLDYEAADSKLRKFLIIVGLET